MFCLYVHSIHSVNAGQLSHSGNTGGMRRAFAEGIGFASEHGNHFIPRVFAFNGVFFISIGKL